LQDSTVTVPDSKTLEWLHQVFTDNLDSCLEHCLLCKETSM